MTSSFTLLERVPESRSAWLMTECGGDAELQREVATLLAAHEQTADVWAISAANLAAEWLIEQAPTPSLSGLKIGHYQNTIVTGQRRHGRGLACA